ncbi:MAG TPA: hypothetical protein PLX88_09700 [Syntrophorhabdaceae bacterium]|jgi:hypothetical protein|nr:hypothetical protein [Syntrophorhabdaceae bacterium]
MNSNRYNIRILGFLVFFLVVPLASYAEYVNLNPSEACSFMSSNGMATRGYKNPDGVGYFCSSPYKEIGTGYPLKNNIAYYAEGDAGKVTKLKLVLNVYYKKEAKQAQTELMKNAETLLKKALKASLPKEAKDAILAGKSGKWKVGDVDISVARENWPTGKGYEIKLRVE